MINYDTSMSANQPTRPQKHASRPNLSAFASDQDTASLTSFVAQARLQQHRQVSRQREASAGSTNASSSSPNVSESWPVAQDTETLEDGDSSTHARVLSTMQRSSSMSSNLSLSSSQNRRKNLPPPSLDLSTNSSQGTYASSRSVQDLQEAQGKSSPLHASTSYLQPAQPIRRIRNSSNKSLSGVSSAQSTDGHSINSGLPASASYSSVFSTTKTDPHVKSDLKAPSPAFMKRSESSSSSGLSEPDLTTHSRRNTATSSLSSPRSPLEVDRSRLIGLAELSTPKWTAAGRTSWNTPFAPMWEHSSQPPLPETPAGLLNASSPYDSLSPTMSPKAGSMKSSASSPSNAIHAIDTLLSAMESDQDHFNEWEASQQDSTQKADSRKASNNIGLGFDLPRSTLAPNSDSIFAASYIPATADSTASFDSKSATPLGVRKSASSSVTRPKKLSTGVEDRERHAVSHLPDEAQLPLGQHKISSIASVDAGSPFVVHDKSPRSSTGSRRQSAGGASVKSHHSSKSYGTPSQVAHAIMRAASHGHNVELDPVQAGGGTAEALRKLDGLGASSPRARRSSEQKSPALTSPPQSARRDSSHPSMMPSDLTRSAKRPRIKSSGSFKDALRDSELSAEPSPALPSPASNISSPRVSSQSAKRIPRSLSSADPVASSSQRDSTSSASYGTNMMSSTTRDSTSLTSVSSSPSLNNISQRQSLSKMRRTSASSDISSFSETSSRRFSGDATMQDDKAIPPVPPLPKDWESRASQALSLTPQPTFNKPLATRSASASQLSTLDKPALARYTDVPEPSPSHDSVSSLPSSALSSSGTKISKKWSISSALGIVKPSFQNEDARSTRNVLPHSASSASVVSSDDTSFRLASNGALGLRASRKSLVSAEVALTPSAATRQPPSTRQTPSGIPFFSRKSSGASKASLETSESSDSSPKMLDRSPELSQEKDRTGRKSILGLTFLGRKADKLSTSEPSQVNMPSTPSFSARMARPLLLSPQKRSPPSEASSPKDHLQIRKRGKTLPSGEAAKPDPQYLPPFNISALDTTTTHKLNHLLSNDLQKTSEKNQLRQSRLMETGSKTNLPTIAGSPSVHPSADKGKIDAGETPTRIPRRSRDASPSSTARESDELGRLNRPVLSKTTSTNPNSSHLLNSTTAAFRRERRTSSATSVSSIPRSVSNSTLQGDRSSRTVTGAPAGSSVLQKHVKRLSMHLSTSVDKPGTPLTNRLSSASVTKKTSTPPISNASSPSLTSSHTRRISSSKITSMLLPKDVDDSKSRTSINTKLSVPTRLVKSSTMPSISRASTSLSDRSSPSSSSRNNTPGDEEESTQADLEMSQYVRRLTAKKLAAGRSSSEIKQMFEFPLATSPTPSLQVSDVVHVFRRDLSEYEMQEILEFERIYFLGQGAAKVMARRALPTNNYGYDDERGDYNVIMNDHILYRYEITGTLGKGSFGQVLQCRDHKTGEMVAVKIIRNKKRFHQQALIEIKVLENLCKWDPDSKHNVIRMTHSFSFRSHLCIVTELLSINLYELVKANNFNGFSTILIRRFTAQILNSLVLLRHHRVVHCDLKPENVLLKHPCKSGVEVIDFGSSCFENEKVYTYIQSRFYRSVEVILGSNYHMAIDMWSLGCIMAELYTGMPLFPGENEQEQLACIMEVLGVPDKHLVERASRRKLFFDSSGAPRPVVNSKGKRRRPGAKSLTSVLKSSDDQFVDFIAKCLIFDPDRRLKPQQALRHPFIRPEIRSLTSPASGLASTQRLSRQSSSSITISTPRRRLAANNTITPANGSGFALGSSVTAPIARTRHTTASSLPSSVSHRQLPN